jgi:hypothetical protein
MVRGYGMGKFRDYIPSKDLEFDRWFGNLVDTVNRKTDGANPAWTHIPASEVALLNAAWGDWRAFYEPALPPHTPAVTLAKDEARAAAKAVIRPFVGQWLVWKQVTDAEREALGLHNRKPRRSFIPVPPTVPELEPRAGNPRQVLVPYRDKGAARRGKPEDVQSIEVRWAFRDTPPEDIERDLFNYAFSTKSPLVLIFGEEDRGRRLYMSGRWAIGRDGIKGDFGDVVTTFVP